jgi:hypothetical protein
MIREGYRTTAFPEALASSGTDRNVRPDPAPVTAGAGWDTARSL